MGLTTMNKTVLAVAMFGAVALSGCIFENDRDGGGGGGGPAAGDIVFTWTFAGGQTCQQVPQVANVQVVIPGQTLSGATPTSPPGTFPCNFQGYDGVDLGQPPFAGGTYPFTLNGLDASGNVLYSASGTVNVNGTVDATVDLSAVGGTAQLSWTFPAANGVQDPSCQQVGISLVSVSIDGNAATSVACAVGQTDGGSDVVSLTTGSHTVSLSALDQNGVEQYAAQGSVAIASGVPTAQSFAFQSVIGGAFVAWTLSTDAGTVDCADAGLSNLFVQFFDSSNTPFFSGNGNQVACSDGSASLLLPTGNYTVQVTGTDSSGNGYSSATNPDPSVFVDAGVFPGAGCAQGSAGCVGSLPLTEL
jgi:hypothetical protein